MALLLDAVTAGPTARIIVGSGDDTQTFFVHKKLLCDSSTYFKAALNNGFKETKDQTITLDDEDPDIFKIFVAWLYEAKLNADMIHEGHRTFEGHLFKLYVFADKRGILNLANDTTTMLASYWIRKSVTLSEVAQVVPLILRDGKMYRLIIDSLLLEIRYGLGAGDLEDSDIPREMLIDILSRATSVSVGFNEPRFCFQSICHYHRHDGQNVLSERDCISRIQAGDNVFDTDEVDLEQQVWDWD